MFKHAYIPLSIKKGVIVILFKGGKKDKKDPNSYRAITLTSCVLKLFEKVILLQLQNTPSLQPHTLQGGSQKGHGCLMSSFILYESIYFTMENKIKLFTCVLDCRQAFDRMWLNGLFYKFKSYRIDISIYKCLLNMYSGLHSSVRYKNLDSRDCFPVLQGTRQGGISSPFMYLVFIRKLVFIRQLENSGYGLCLAGVDFSSVSVADDMVLISLTNFGLQKTLEICY